MSFVYFSDELGIRAGPDRTRAITLPIKNAYNTFFI
jgi:hypothetical protein